MNESDVRLLTVRETCERLGVSRTKVYELLGVGPGRLRSLQIGSSRRIRSDDLQNFIDSLTACDDERER